MKKSITTLAAALMLAGAILPTVSTSAEARKGRNTALAAGVVLGVAAAALLSSGAQARPRRTNWQRYCSNLYNKCINGSNYSCQKYETGGCTE